MYPARAMETKQNPPTIVPNQNCEHIEQILKTTPDEELFTIFQPQEPQTIPLHWYTCAICNKNFTSTQEFEKHKNSKSHLIKLHLIDKSNEIIKQANQRKNDLKIQEITSENILENSKKGPNEKENPHSPDDTNSREEIIPEV